MFYNYQDFSKRDKKLFEPLLQRGINREIERFLKKSLTENKSILESGNEDIRDQFWELSENFETFSKHLVKTYDGNSHRILPQSVVVLTVNGLLSEEELLADFSENGKEKLIDFLKTIKEIRK